MRNPKGFTLIELVVLLAIVAILASVAVPNFASMIKNDRDVSQINTLLTGLALARSEAVKTSNPVTICAGVDTTCAGATWAGGWVVYYNVLPPGVTNPIIRTFPAISGSDTVSSSSGTTFTFNAQGMTGVTNTFTLCDQRGVAYAHAIDLNITGRAEAAPKVGYEINGTTAIPSC